ncbi:MAG: exodeoxyribonuclease VII small subunit [Pseudomonadota bacterium]
MAAAGSRKSKDKAIDLEKALGELETLVDELERGDLPLDKALKQFEKGVALTRDCEAALTAAERKVELLMADAGLDDTPKPFGDDED